MADVCVSLLLVLGLAWVGRMLVDGSGRRPLTGARRRLWVFLSLAGTLVVQIQLAGLGLVAWWSTAVPATLLVGWLVLCRLMVRPVARRTVSPATVALVAASVVAAWVAVNPMGENPTKAVAATSTVRQAQPLSRTTVTPPTSPTRSGTTRRDGAGTVMATRGAIVLVGNNARLTANTGPTSSSGAVGLGVEGSDLRAGDSDDPEPPAATKQKNKQKTQATHTAKATHAATAAPEARRQRTRPTAGTTQSRIGHENSTLATLTKGGKGLHGTALSGFEDHSVSVVGDDQIVTYDDSNVFIDRKGEINANTGDTDSSGLNAVDVGGSTVRAGNSGDGEGSGDDDDSPAEELAEEAASPATSFDENRLSAPAGRTTGKSAFGTVTDEGASSATGKNSFVVGADGYDDISIRSRGRNDIVTYDDSNVTIGGEGKVNAQIGDSDTGGAVVMGIQDSDTRAGCEGDLCYSATPTVQLVLELLRAAGVHLTPTQWNQVVAQASSTGPSR